MNERFPRIRADALQAQTPILDVRRCPHEYQIRGALRYDPQALLGAQHVSLPIDKKEPMALYGDSEDIVRAVVSKLRHEGYAASVLEGGIENWRDNGLPVEELRPVQTVPA
ncbi:MAG: rhodanese-like domain-containing protein [Candidatus Tyrphobacter sp.]